jgi:hypothetical protein
MREHRWRPFSAFLLDGFLDQSRTQAARADADPLVALPDDRTHGLNIWIEHTPGLIICMADVIPGDRLLEAHFTHKCHDRTPSR